MVLRSELLGTPFHEIQPNSPNKSTALSPTKSNLLKYKTEKTTKPADSPFSLSPIR